MKKKIHYKKYLNIKYDFLEKGGKINNRRAWEKEVEMSVGFNFTKQRKKKSRNCLVTMLSKTSTMNFYIHSAMANKVIVVWYRDQNMMKS